MLESVCAYRANVVRAHFSSYNCDGLLGSFQISPWHDELEEWQCDGPNPEHLAYQHDEQTSLSRVRISRLAGLVE